MRKLLFVSTITGTLKHFLLPFARHFRNDGWQVDAAANGAADCPVCATSFNQVWHIDWSRRPLDLGNLTQASEQIRALILREGYDLVHVHTPIASFITRFALRKRQNRRPPVIYTTHGFHFHQGGKALGNWFYRQLEKTAGRWTDYLVTINQEDYQAAARYGLIPQEHLRYIPGIGVDQNQYHPARVSRAAMHQVRTSLGMATGDRLLLVVGELNRNKRPELILDAFATLPRPDLHLAYAGNGSLELSLRKRARQLGIERRIHLLGSRSDIPTLLATADALIQGSRREGLPRSIMEALCMQTPCIGSNVRGTRDLLHDGCGLLFPTDDQAGLAQAISWLLDHPRETRNMVVRGQKKIADYAIEQILKQHEDLYDEALATP